MTETRYDALPVERSCRATADGRCMRGSFSCAAACPARVDRLVALLAGARTSGQDAALSA